jgi:HEPN domain-containing protein
MVGPEEAWNNKAAYDLETAKAMLDARRFVYVLFCCQQAVEKYLKGAIAERRGTCSPRIHQLVRLAELAEA